MRKKRTIELDLRVVGAERLAVGERFPVTIQRNRLQSTSQRIGTASQENCCRFADVRLQVDQTAPYVFFCMRNHSGLHLLQIRILSFTPSIEIPTIIISESC